ESRVNPHESQTTYEGVSGNFKSQSSKWLIWIRVSNYFFLRVRVGSLHSRQIVGRRQVSHHRIQKGLYPFIFKCRSTKYRREIHVDNRLMNSSQERKSTRLNSSHVKSTYD